MTKAMFGIAAAVTLLTTSAGASDEPRTSRSEPNPVASRTERASIASDARGEVDEGMRVAAAAEATVGEGAPVAVRDFDARAWVTEREGYRDGGH